MNVSGGEQSPLLSKLRKRLAKPETSLCDRENARIGAADHWKPSGRSLGQRPANGTVSAERGQLA
jgi:hypothetical protein